VSERWITRGEAALVAELRPELERARRDGGTRHGACEVAGRRARFKLGPLGPRAGLRHGVRRALGLGLPTLREFANLGWLRDNGFDAPRPLAAGALLRNGLPRFQFLFTEEVAGARTVRAALETGPPRERGPLIETIAREVARLHARGFVHRDLFQRNLLVTDGPGRPRIHFLDAWRGGPGLGLRGADYDLACFFLYGADLLSPAEGSRFLEEYFATREALGAATARRAFLRSATRARRRLARRELRRGRTPPGVAPPSLDWAR